MAIKTYTTSTGNAPQYTVITAQRVYRVAARDLARIKSAFEALKVEVLGIHKDLPQGQAARNRGGR